MSKINITERDDLIVFSKNGRAISEGTARRLLAQRYPGVEWDIILKSHRTIARRHREALWG